MNIGFGSADITPWYGMARPGSARPVRRRGVHDPGLVNACVIDDGEPAIAIVGIRALAALKEVKPPIQAEIQALRVGDAAFVTNPAEYFTSLGGSIKDRSPFRRTWVATLTNSCIGFYGSPRGLVGASIPVMAGRQVDA